MEFERSGQMLEEVERRVAAGVEVILVPNLLSGEQIVQSLGASVEAVVVFASAVEINMQAAQRSGATAGSTAVRLSSATPGTSSAVREVESFMLR